jgi:hypothetical protein
MKETIEKSFATPDGCQLLIENVKGEIAVQGWDRPETRVIAVRHQDWVDVEIVQDGNKVSARTRAAHGDGEHGIAQWLNWLTPGRTPTVDYDVRVPHASDIRVKNVNGPIQVERTQGKVRVNNVDGSTTVQGVDGDLRAETVNGALHVAEFRGAADLKTVNGAMDLQKGNVSKLSAQTVNGNITISAALDEDGEYTFNTVNGSCKLHVPADFRASVTAQGVNLHVDSAQPEQSIRRQFGNWRGTIGPEQESEPAAQISFHTVNGHLSIDNAGAAAEVSTPYVAKADASPEPPEPPPPSEPGVTVEVKTGQTPSSEERAGEPQPKSQLEILQMVERGEMTVDEAAQLLEN